MGELIKAIPKAGNGKLDSQCSEIPKSKMQTIKESGLTQRQAEHFQLMAKHPEYVEIAKKKARKEGTVLSRNAVIQQIVNNTKPKNPIKEMERQAEERHEEFDSSAKTISFDDIRQDKEDLVSHRNEVTKTEEARRKAGEEYTAYTLRGTFQGEEEATAELIAAEKGLDRADIVTKIINR